MLLRDKLGDEQEDVSVASLPWDKITCSVAWFYFHCDTKLECNPYAILVSSGAEFFSTSCKSSSDVSDQANYDTLVVILSSFSQKKQEGGGITEKVRSSMAAIRLVSNISGTIFMAFHSCHCSSRVTHEGRR